jgi:hypothetical protein
MQRAMAFEARESRGITSAPASRGGVAGALVDVGRFAVGFIGGAANKIGGAVVDTAVAAGALSTCAFGGTVCTNMLGGVAAAGAGVVADPGEALRSTARSAANTIGRLRADLLSGDGYRAGGAVADMTIGATAVVGGVGAARGGLAATRSALAGRGASTAASTGSPAQLVAGRAFEAQQLDVLGLSKNTNVWRPTAAQADSSAFRVIVGEAKQTPGGQLTGVIPDAAGLEIKGGSSALGSSYQLRLMTYRALAENDPLTILTSRPVVPSFQDWLTRWGVGVEAP